MFDRIAGVYDRMNTVMTAGMHHRWRARAAALAQVQPGDRVLDVATGTGDLALELARRVAPGGSVVGADFSARMLELADAKLSGLLADGRAPRDVEVHFERANALELPYADGEFAAATVGFGARNFSDLDRGLSELARVVRPGGRVVVLEITTAAGTRLAGLLDVWFERVVPLLGRLAGDADAYSYLPSSVRRFPSPPALADAMWRAGLEGIHWVLTAGGMIALHVGVVRA